MKEHKYYVYIMASRSRRLYTGITNDMYRRALEHKAGETDGFTKKYKINRLVYYEVFKYVGNAIAREKQIKGWDRAKRVALIERDNPTWEDLAADWGKPIPPVERRDDKREVFAFRRGGVVGDSPVAADEKQIPRRCAPRDDNHEKFVITKILNSKTKV